MAYQVGGIFQALKNSNETDDKDENELSELFSFKPVEKEEDEIPDEEIEAFINAVEEPKEVKMIKKKPQNNEKVGRKKFDEESPERKARTVFVGNVALTVSKKVLKKLFSKFGEIENIRIRSVPRADPKTSKKVAFIKKEFHTERDNMNAYVVFKSKEDAVKSLKSNGMLLEDKHIRVDLSDNKKHDTTSSIFVGNLPFNIKEDVLREHFVKCGEIKDVRVIRDKATGIGKGFAYVHFQDKENVMFGLKMNDSELKGRKIRVYKARSQDEVSNGGVSKKNFQGLRSTSQKDIKMGKKLFADKNKPTKRSNALRRIKDKNVKSRQKKPMKAQKKQEKSKANKGKK